MWQKHRGKYHLLLGMNVPSVREGRFLGTACQEQIQVRKKNQVQYPLERKCAICSGVSHLVYTSVDEARRFYLPKETRLVVLYRALELTQSKTLKAAIEARILRVAETNGKEE
jgi:hypothetical protein